ncbi:MAG: hypothetical protein SAJ12_10500 [Jaaginema sp. PMC 1079.18]|nr:hypothetical protein [Jaaginema sp. PMC 1080.18]MEC4851431.1 hypothetical protein [Jaaginema sp. PMC 1079.18]MEC4866099.1 hypothetical protein [Jaaginema sp. PMC 1078.18]
MRQTITNTNAIASQLNYSHSGNPLTIWDSDSENLLTQLGSNPNYSHFSYSAKIKSLTAHWLIADGPQINRLLRPDGLIEPRTSEYLHQGKILSLWISKGAAQPIKFGEVLMLRIGGYRYQSLDLLQAFGSVPAGKDSQLYARIENVGSGYLGPGDEVILQGEVEEAIAYEDNRENDLDLKLSNILLKLSNIQVSGNGVVATASASTMTEILQRDATWTRQWFDGEIIWRSGETATGKLKLGYLSLKNKLLLAISGGHDANQGVLKIIRIRRSDDTLLMETDGSALLNFNTNNLRPCEIDTSAHAGEEIYLEFDDSDSNSGWAWFGIHDSFWVE